MENANIGRMPPHWALDPFIRKEMAPKSGVGPGHQHLPPGSLRALTCLKSTHIPAFGCFQPSLLPPAVEKKNSYVFSKGSKQAGSLQSDPCLCPVRRRTATQPTTLLHTN